MSDVGVPLLLDQLFDAFNDTIVEVFNLSTLAANNVMVVAAPPLLIFETNRSNSKITSPDNAVLLQGGQASIDRDEVTALLFQTFVNFFRRKGAMIFDKKTQQSDSGSGHL